jgi:TonB-linked SusC/RagA family outer membrane protein
VLDQLYAGSSSNQEANSNSNNVYGLANQGFVGRFNYDYMGNYLVEIGFRYDGSSKFAEGACWGFFPYGSVGWRISEENFMDFFNALDDLKIRASYGVLGDDAASRYQFLTGYTYPSSGFVFGGDFITGLGFLGMPNREITWFTAETANIGIDGSLWRRALYFNLDVFRRYRDGLLATRLMSLPATVGANLSEENLESDLSRGYEIVLGHANDISDFNYDISFNFAYTRTRWDNKEEPEAGNSYLNWLNSEEGRFKNIWWGYDQIGQFTSQEDIYTGPIQDGNGNRELLPGDFKYEDWNEDGIINDLDRQPVGFGTIPEINYGINISMSWKGLDLNALFHGSGRFNRRNWEFLTYPLPWGQNGLKMFMDRWHRSDPFDPQSEWIPGKYPSTRIPTVVPWNYWDSDFWIEDGTFLRLRSVELGYSFPARWMNKIGFNNLRVFANGYNVFLLSKALSGVDPEIPSSGSPYPMFKNFNFGITVNL